MDARGGWVLNSVAGAGAWHQALESSCNKNREKWSAHDVPHCEWLCEHALHTYLLLHIRQANYQLRDCKRIRSEACESSHVVGVGYKWLQIGCTRGKRPSAGHVCAHFPSVYSHGMLLVLSQHRFLVIGPWASEVASIQHYTPVSRSIYSSSSDASRYRCLMSFHCRYRQC